MVKYRPSHKIDKKKKEIKTWCQKNSDTTPLLFNMNRINTSAPLLITEGELDCAAAIESGYLNTVSVPLGAQNYHWMEENWDWLEQFDSIILCSDNDEPGNAMRKEAANRLGTWRTRFVEIPYKYNGKFIKDLNELLYHAGKDAVMDVILNAKDTPVNSVIDFSDIQALDLSEMDGIQTGFKELDRTLFKLFYGTFNIVTGINGCVSADTEYFNGTKWVPISAYMPGDRVLQYNRDGSTSLVVPKKYHKYPCSQLYYFSSCDGVDQTVSSEHNMVYSKRGNLYKIPAHVLMQKCTSVKKEFQGKFITTFKYTQKGVPCSTQELRVVCAAICRGNFMKKMYQGRLCKVQLYNVKEIVHMEKLLRQANITFQTSILKGSATISFFPTQNIMEFGTRWYQCSRRQMKIIASEFMYWSYAGHHIGADTEDIANFMQFVFSTNGCRSVVIPVCKSDYLRGELVHKQVNYIVTIENNSCASLKGKSNQAYSKAVPSTDGYKYCFTVPSGMLVLRHNGHINVTGNSGKSSFLTQLICQCLEQNQNAFLYSGELPNYQTKNWINYIFAGRRNVNQYQYKDSDITYYNVNKAVQPKIDEYYRGKLFVYKDSYSHKAEDILDSMEGNARKHGCKLFVIDNLTSIALGGKENEKWDRQEKFITKLIAFATKFHVTVILVVHPHKIDRMRRLTKMDVQGISAIIDLAHRIISLYRVQDSDRKPRKEYGREIPPLEGDVVCDILKDRMRGYEGKTIPFYYDTPSRRFFTSYEDLYYQYGWDKTDYTGIPDPYPVPQLEQQPF